MHRFLICENRLPLLHSTQCSDPVCCTDTHTEAMHPVYLDNWAFSVKVDGEDDEEDDLEDEGWACHRVEDCGPLAQPGFWKHCMLIGENKQIFVFKRRVSRDYYLYFFSFKAIRPEINGVLLMVYTVLFESLLCAAHRGARQILWSAGYTKVRIYAI